MATNLGELFYSLRIQDLTDQDIKAINSKLKNLGSNIQINGSDLKNAITTAINNVTLKVGSVTNLKQAIKDALGDGAKINIDKDAFSTAFNSALANAQRNGISINANLRGLRRQIESELSNPFYIQIQVMQNQARQAVQNALNQASNVTSRDALAYQRLKTGEYKAEQAALTRLKAAHLEAGDAARKHAKATVELNSSMGSNIRIAGELGAAMASLYSVHQLKDFLSHVIEIGGELEHQKIALDTIYGDPSKTQTLFSQIKGLARQSPFGVMDLTKNIKQLSAYGVVYNEVYDTAKRLADISAATSVDINRLILAFGKTKNRTFLDGLEAKQFAYANIPIYEALSQKLSELEGKFVSVKDVMKKISKREIGFDMVKEILWDMTDEGGKFYNMQEKLAGSVKTSWKLVRDNIELMFGEMAESGVGSFLKSIAETLQGLTRQWRTLATVMGTMAAIFGVSRLAALGLSRAVDSQTASLTTNMLAGKKKQAEDLQRASITRKLTIAEIELISTQNTLTAAELKHAVTNGNLTKQQLKQLYVSKQVSKATLEQLTKTGALTQAEYKAIVGSNFLGMSINRLKGSLKGLGVMLSNVGKSLLALAANPATWIMAAVGAAMAVWQKYSQEQEKAKEIGDNLFTKATEGARSLMETLENIKAPEKLSTLELKQGIESMENALKDYSPTPIHDINEALYTQEGLLRPIQERYEILRQKLEELKNAFDDIEKKNLSSTIEGAINYSGGWFNDDVNTNAMDYDKSLKKRNNAITEYYAENTKLAVAAVNAALQEDEAFRKATEGMKTYAQKFRELVINRNKYVNAAQNNTVKYLFGEKAIANLSKDLQADQKELEKDMQKVWRFIAARAKEEGIESLADATEDVKKAYVIMIKDWINEIGVGDETKQFMFKIFSNLFKTDMETIDAGDKLLNEFSKNEFSKLRKELADKVKNGLSLTPDEQREVNTAIYRSYLKLIDGADDNMKNALNKAIGTLNSEDNRYHMDASKFAILTAQLNLRADWEQWQREIDDIIGNIPEVQTWVKGAPDYESFIKATREGYKTAQTTVNELEPLMLKAGIEFVAGEEIDENGWDFQSAKPYVQEMIKSYNEAIRAIKGAKKASEELGFSLTDPNKKGKGSGGSKKDSIAEKFRQQFKDIKDAWAEYKKWEKSVGDQAAATEIEISGLFGDLKPDEIPHTIEEYQKAIEKIRAELEKNKVKGYSQRESLLNEILKTLLDVKKTIVDEQIEKALAVVDEEIEKKIEEYNLYEKIKEATGNKNLAYAFTFGLEEDAQTDYEQLLKDNFNERIDAVRDTLDEVLEGELKGKAFTLDFEQINNDNVKQLPVELQKAWKEAVNNIKKYQQEQRNLVADLLGEYQNTLEKIQKIRGDAQNKIEEVMKNKDLNEEQKNNLVMKIKVKADYEEFQLSSDYLQFFGGVLALTKEEAEKIGGAIRSHLDQQLQNGVLTAKEYYDEIEKIEEQLTKIRNIKSDALTFMTEGFSGLNNKKSEESAAKTLKISQEIEMWEQKAAKAREENDWIAAELYERQANAAKVELTLQEEITKKIVKNEELWGKIAGITGLVSNIIGGIGDSFDTIKEMAESLGADIESGAWLDMQGLIDTFEAMSDSVNKIVQGLMSGDLGGVLSGATSLLLTPITIWAQIHDKKLQKDIEASKWAYDRYQSLIDRLESQFQYFLGNRRNFGVDISADKRELEKVNNLAQMFSQMGLSSNFVKQRKEAARYEARINAYNEGGALGYERQLMIEQLAELERQRADYEAMKGNHSDDIEDITQQIEEQKQAIRDFAYEMANITYGIDLNDWASQIGDALVDAFAKGEDAAEAFKKTVGSIMKNLVSNMITNDLIAPAMRDIETWLFGEDGTGGVYGKDFLLDEDNAAELGTRLMGLESVVDDAKSLYDAINGAMDGIMDDKDSSDNKLRVGIQSITEDTADLLASYVNAIRAYCAEDSLKLDNIITEAFPKLNAIAEGQLQQLVMIAENTRRNMEAAEAIRESNQNLYTLMSRVTTGAERLYVN